MKQINIAIDGFSSCGKSTLAKQLAKELGYTYIDSGAMYRACTLYALNNGFISGGVLDAEDLIRHLDDISIRFAHDMESGQSQTMLNGKNVESRIRGIEVSRHVSAIARVPEVREKLVMLQQALGQEGGVVMDGRDIGTVVFPNAELKIYMTASPEIRARRRYEEMKMKDLGISFESVMANINSRDRIDTTRKKDPLRMAEDAVLLDNSEMSPEEQLNFVQSLVAEKSENRTQA